MISFYKKLSEVPIEDIRLGDLCVSALGNMGTITILTAQKYASQSEDNEIQIDWETGKVSRCWHFQMDKIQYIGKPNVA